MATQFCQQCKQSHPGQVCDSDDRGECSETIEVDETQEIRDWQLEELLENTRKVLRRSQELIQQSDRLVKQSRELRRDFDLLPQGVHNKSKSCDN